MKFLKKYNEAFKPSKKKETYDIKELDDFCKESLAYLLDFNIKLSVKAYSNRNSIFIKSKNESGYDGINWSDLKDDLIPFVEMLSNKYDIIKKLEFYVTNKNTNRLSYFYPTTDEIINDELDDTLSDYEILQVQINLRK